VTITLDIRPEVEAELARRAAAYGLRIEAYVAIFLEGAASVTSGKPVAPAQAKDIVELFAPLRGLNIDFERDRKTGG
jgi:hypothetical protein